MHPPETTGGHVHAGTSKTLMVKDDEGGGGRSAWDKMRGESVSGEQHPSARPLRKSRMRDPNWQAPETTGGQRGGQAGQKLMVKDDDVIWDKMRGESVSGEQHPSARPVRKSRKRDPNWQAPETTGGQVHDNAGQNVVVKDDEVSGGRSIWDKMRGESVSGQQCAPASPIRKARMARKPQALA